MPDALNSYDSVAYPGHANAETHPDNLATIARLHGLTTPDVATCRVLELGCSRGNNLIPMAYAMPGAQFFGVDLAREPIAYGQQKIEELGLSNIHLRQADLMELDETIGSFDYIIAHGVYAWVPEPVRDGLLAQCKRLLSPNGVVFLSYNTLPGGHLRRMIREMMLFQAGGVCENEQAANRALDYVQFISECLPEDDLYRPIIERQIRQMRKKGANTLFHDELEPAYQPISFVDFVSHAARHGLQYLGESTVPPPTDPCYNPEVTAKLRIVAGGDPIATEQSLDYLRMRMYRETLLCHSTCDITHDLSLPALNSLRISSRVHAEEPAATGERTYTLPDGKSIESRHPAVIAILDALIAAWPRSVSMADLEAKLMASGLPIDADLFPQILRLFSARIVQLRTWQAPVAASMGPTPRISAWVRSSLSEPYGAASLLHLDVLVNDPVLRDLVLLLDGSRDRDRLLESLSALHPEIPKFDLEAGLDSALALLLREGCCVDATLT